MTREDAIDWLCRLKSEIKIFMPYQWQRPFGKALDMAIKALEQEPRKGHWIEHEWEEMREKGYYRCSVCNHGYQRYTKGIRKSDVPYIDGQEYILRNCDNYCPNCGADMREVVEE